MHTFKNSRQINTGHIIAQNTALVIWVGILCS